MSTADPLQSSSSTNDKNQQQEKVNQVHDTTELTSSSKLRSTPAQDKLNMEEELKKELKHFGLEMSLVYGLLTYFEPKIHKDF